MDNIVYKIAENQTELDSYFAHLEHMIFDCNGKNGFPYFSPRTSLPPKDEFLGKFVNELCKNPEEKLNQVLVALYNNEVIGHAVIARLANLESLDHRRLINGFGVSKDFMGKGIAKQVLTETVKFCKEIGVNYVDLGVLTENTRALKLYENFGFQKTGELKDFCRINGKSLDDIQMTYKL